MKYPESESATVEFKREFPTKNQITKTLIGFCNTFGGHLVVGVGDDGKIIGISEENLEEEMENLRRSIFTNCAPEVMPSIYSKRLGDKIVLIIEVSKGVNKPYYLTSKGIENGTYIRFGTETLKASKLMIEDLKWQSRGKNLDEMPVYNASKEDLNSEGFRYFWENRIKKTAEITDFDEMPFHYNLLITEHQTTYPTIAGMLLFGKNPQKFLSESFIICTHFAGTEGREAIATQDFTGPLFDQFKGCYPFILSRLSSEFFIGSDGIRHEQLEIPEDAIRETLINALVHRHYSTPSPTKIAIYDDRIEIFSPGNFPGPIREKHLQLGLSYLRNTVISRVFREMGITEKLGTGFITIFSSYKNRGLIRPIIKEGVGFVKCILPRPLPNHRQLVKLDEHCLEVMRLFYTKKEIKISDIMKLLSVSRATAGRYLKQLINGNFIQRLGKGRDSMYCRTFG